jgi:hypothetical protein
MINRKYVSQRYLPLFLFLVMPGCGGGGGNDNDGNPNEGLTSYPVEIAVSGLIAGELRLLNNGSDLLVITANGHYLFGLGIVEGSPYQVSIDQQPQGSLCSLSNENGIAASDMSVVQVTCVASGVDDDSDGVSNDQDLCPETPIGQPVDMQGCPTNSDGQTDLDVVLDMNSSRTAIVTDYGGSISVQSSDGTGYTLSIPPGAIAAPGGMEITLTPASTVTGLDVSGNYIAAVEIEPEGTVFSVPALLTIHFAHTIQPENLLSFTYENNGNGAYFLPILPDFYHSDRVSIPLVHASGHGVASGTDSDIVSNVPPPSVFDSKYSQQLASRLNQAIEEIIKNGGGNLTDTDLALVNEILKNWQKEQIERFSSISNCMDIQNGLRSMSEWLLMTQMFGMTQQEFPEFKLLSNALISINSAIRNEVDSLNVECNTSTDICALYDSVERLIQCQMYAEQLSGLGSSSYTQPYLADSCNRIPAVINMQPQQTGLCPGDTAPLSVSVYGQDGVTPFNPNLTEWHSSDSTVIKIDDSTASAIAAGTAQITVTIDCDIKRTTTMSVSAPPDLTGNYSGWGSESLASCIYPEDNVMTSGKADIAITNQIDLGDGSASFSMGYSGTSFDGHESGVGMVYCGGRIEGSAYYTEADECGIPSVPCTVSGSTEFHGQVNTFSGSIDLPIAEEISVFWVSEDQSGDTCTSRGSGTLTR